jgi:hypothetical protein
MAAKVDIVRDHQGEYATPRDPRLITVSRARYLAVTGSGAPTGDAFQEAIGALYGAAYTIKMARKRAGRDFKVAPLEGLWWVKTGPMPPDRPEGWSWTLLIRVPDFVAAKDLRDAVKVLVKRGKGATVRRVKLQTVSEGRCVQVLHVGPYDAEAPTIARMKSFAGEQGLAFRGKHHEIYFSDPRRVPASRLRTILRQPVRLGGA